VTGTSKACWWVNSAFAYSSPYNECSEQEYDLGDGRGRDQHGSMMVSTEHGDGMDAF
jgi:hypothetical protein